MHVDLLSCVALESWQIRNVFEGVVAIRIYKEVTGVIETLLITIITHSHHLQDELLQIAQSLLPNRSLSFVQGRKISYALNEVFEFDKLVEVEVVGEFLNVFEELRPGEKVAHLGTEERVPFCFLFVDIGVATTSGRRFRLRVWEVSESHAHERVIGGERLIHGRVKET